MAIAAALNAKQCHIFSDVDGVYTADPNKVEGTQKLKNLSYSEMQTLSSEGAKVLQERAVEIANKFQIPIITKSTFNNQPGTIISNEIENYGAKSLVKKDCSRLTIVGSGMIKDHSIITKLLEFIEENDLELLEINISELKITLTLKNTVTDEIVNKIHAFLFCSN